MFGVCGAKYVRFEKLVRFFPLFVCGFNFSSWDVCFIADSDFRCTSMYFAAFFQTNHFAIVAYCQDFV